MLTVHIQYKIKPDSISLFRQALIKNAKASVLEPGVIRFDIFQDCENENDFSLLEVYRDEAARQDHFNSMHFKEWKKFLEGNNIVLEKHTTQWNHIFPNNNLLAYPMRPYAWSTPIDIPEEAEISLVEINDDNLRDVLNLSVDAYQRQFVAENSRSLAQAAFEPKAWYRAIYADSTPIGFVMLFIDPDKPTYYLWRYMIDHRYQGRGFGKKALEQVIDFVKKQPSAQEFSLSYVPAPGAPNGFYAKLGFVETGIQHDSEMEMKLTW